MSKAKSSRPLSIPARKWAIPVPPMEMVDQVLPSATVDYQALTKELSAMGFVQLSDIKGHDIADSSPRKGVIQSFSIWCHPAGVIACCSSDRYQPNRMARISLAMELDTGVSQRFYDKISLSLTGEARSFQKNDGTRVWFGVVHLENISGLKNLLCSIQKSARIVPFKKWNTRADALLLPPHLYAQLSFEDVNGVGLDERPARLASRRIDAWGALLRRAPKAAFDFLSDYNPCATPSGALRVDWLPAVEGAMKMFRQLASLTGVSFLPRRDSALFCRWSDHLVAADAPVFAKHAKVLEEGIGGASFASALAMSLNISGNPDRMLDLIANAPQQVVEKWVLVPDASGHTLLTRLVDLGMFGFGVGSDGDAVDTGVVCGIVDAIFQRVDQSRVDLSAGPVSLGAMSRKWLDINENKRGSFVIANAQRFGMFANDLLARGLVAIDIQDLDTDLVSYRMEQHESIRQAPGMMQWLCSVQAARISQQTSPLSSPRAISRL